MFHPILGGAILKSGPCKGAFVLKSKQLSSFFLVFLLALTIASPLKLAAQDEIPVSDDEVLTPSGNTNSDTPPTIIDESDSGSVSDVEEYDG